LTTNKKVTNSERSRAKSEANGPAQSKDSYTLPTLTVQAGIRPRPKSCQEGKIYKPHLTS